MPGEHETTVIRVSADDAGYRTVAVTGVLDREAVAAVQAAAEQANTAHERLVLDLLGVTRIEGDCVTRLARALRGLGINLDVLSAPSGPEIRAENPPT